MALLSLRLVAFFFVALLSSSTSGAPTPGGGLKDFRPWDEIVKHIQKTTVTPTGVTLDWIPIDKQLMNRSIAEPPPLLNTHFARLENNAFTELQQPGAELGPHGTVPVPRYNEKMIPRKSPPPTQQAVKKYGKRGYNGAHWYVTSNFGTVVRGAKAVFSLFRPFVTPNDFSLMQIAISRGGLPTGLQTVEAGYQMYPAFNKQPRLFTFYTVNGYQQLDDNLGGYDQRVKGWVQYSRTYFPGTAVTQFSTFGGTQYEANLEYYWYQGNWWLWMYTEWIGYYPGSLFSANQPDASKTLANSGDMIYFYGEIAQTEDDMTTTDMGSGKSAMLGWKQSAYMRNLQYADVNSKYTDYPVSTIGYYSSDMMRYNYSTTMPPGGRGWGQYVYLGGAGAGGKTGS